MRTAWIGLAVLGISMMGAGCGLERNPTATYLALEEATKLARDKVYPATVRVDARRTDYVGGKKQRVGGNGSGVIFDPQGHILTNYHVAGRAEELTCILYNKERVKARLVGCDPWTDLAVIQLDLDEIRQKGITFDFAPFGDSDRMEEGDGVLAIGSPYGLSRSISSGIVSCRDRILGTALDLGGGLETGLFNTWIQTDAAINPGNSGGPLVNFRGEVVGINTRGGGNDLGFAVPINVAKEVVRQILDKGKVTRSTIGLALQPLQDLESFFDVGKTEGAVVASVEPGGPAAKAGIQPQDVLFEYNGAKIQGRYAEQLFDLRRRVSDTPVGAAVEIRVKRGGEIRTVQLVTEDLTTVRSEEENFLQWGLVGQDITERLAQRENLPAATGVYVTGVRSGEPAEKANVQAGDVILRVDDHEVANVRDLKRAYEDTNGRKQTLVLLKVRRGQAILPILLRITYEGAKKPDEKKTAEEPAAAKPPPEPANAEPQKPVEPKKEEPAGPPCSAKHATQGEAEPPTATEKERTGGPPAVQP
jgi:serine protease Do